MNLAWAVAAFALHSGDCVGFYGDSITEQRLYTTYVEDYVLTRHPSWAVDFVNAGWASDTVSGGFGGPIDQRLQRDLLAYHPSVVTVMLGMNDGHRLAWNEPMATAFEVGYRHLLDVLARQAPAARVTLLQPSPYDDVTRPVDYPGGYNGVLLRFGAFVAEQARVRNLGLADLNGPVTQMLTRANASQPELAKKLIPDRYHPGAAAHWVMAASVLERWGATPWVSKVKLAVVGGRLQAAAAEQAHVTVTGPLAWTTLEEALPLPIDRTDEATRLVLASADVEERLNQEPLHVTGLAPGRYRLDIDDRPVGTFEAAQFAAGVDLAKRDTPMTRQALQVHALTVAHQGVRFTRWRGAAVATADWPSAARDQALASLAALDADLVQRQRQAAQPRPHRFVLTPD
ncbi:MAG: lipolytic enzyme family [Cyanobacteria bacterium RYN_339]|nr:lipolytic enzyme family [Cyanobacteria bacterium RYN_339]